MNEATGANWNEAIESLPEEPGESETKNLEPKQSKSVYRFRWHSEGDLKAHRKSHWISQFMINNQAARIGKSLETFH